MRRTFEHLGWLLFLAAAAAALFVSARWFSSALADEDPRALVERGAYKQARALLAPRLAANPTDAEALWLMSRVTQAYGDPKSALALAEQALALDARNADYHLQVAEVCGQMAQKSGPLKGMGLGKRFRREAEAAIALDPRQLDAREDMMHFYWEAPGIVGGDKKKAQAMADSIEAMDPVRGNLAHAALALEKKDSTAAEGFYRRAAELGAASYEAQVSAAGWYTSSSQQRWDLAERHARAACALDPRRAGPYTVLAGIYARQQRWAALDSILAAARAAVPGNLTPCYAAGRALLLEGGDPVRAEGCFRAYLDAEPEGNAPTLAHAHWRLGLALDRQGKHADAIAELETAVRLKPDLDDAKKDLKRLRRA